MTKTRAADDFKAIREAQIRINVEWLEAQMEVELMKLLLTDTKIVFKEESKIAD